MKKPFQWLLCVTVAFFLLITLPANAQSAPEQVLLVNAQHPLPDGFSADDLVELYGKKRSFKLASSDICLSREAFEAANQMFRQANLDGIDGFTITSGYRTEEVQRALYEKGANRLVAKPGTSEHQSGLAFDVTTRYDNGGFQDTEQFRWLSRHCWDFGFILRYPEGKEHITGIPYEPWHYRYVGQEVAYEIRDNGWTLEEYCERKAYQND